MPEGVGYKSQKTKTSEELKIPRYENKPGKCPPGFAWSKKKKKCVQLGVGPEFKP